MCSLTLVGSATEHNNGRSFRRSRDKASQGSGGTARSRASRRHGVISCEWFIVTGRICQFSALTYCLALPLLALVPDPAIWALALFVFGAGHGALDVAMNAQAIAIEKRYHRPVMSSFHALFSIVESTIKRFVKKQQKSAEEVRGGQSHSQTRSLGWTIANHLAGQAHHGAYQGAHGDTSTRKRHLGFSTMQ